MKDNCLPWSFKKYLKHGGYLVIRRTRLGKIRWWPHFLWLPPECDITGEPCKSLQSFVPTEKKIRLVPPIIFDGYEKKGDADDS